jgi:hypothetical protein
MLQRFAVDDGRHHPTVVIDEDASTTAGTARYRVTCACGQMPPHTPGDEHHAYRAHAVHAAAVLGPAGTLTGVRAAVLVVLLFLTWGAVYAAGEVVAAHYGLGPLVPSLASLGGFAVAFAVMVAARRFVTRV